MRNSWILLAAFMFSGCVIDSTTERRLQESFPIEEGQTLRVELPVAELEVRAADRSDVLVDLTVGCRWRWSECEHQVDNLALSTHRSPRRMLLEIGGLDTWKGSMVGIEGVIEVPTSTALDIEMEVGELDVSGVTGDVDIDLGVGELRLEMPKASVGEAFVTVKIGEARLSGNQDREENLRSGLVGSRLRWQEGPGNSEIDLEVGIGEATVRLD